MKRHKLHALGILLGISLAAYGQQADVARVTLEKITGNIYEIRGGRGSNGGLFIGKEGALVIDAKMDKASVDQTLELIRQVTDKPVRYLVNTHSDGDHVNGNVHFPPTVTIISHERCREEFFIPGRDGTPSAWLSPEMLPHIPHITFNERLDVHLGSDRVELWYFGRGHTSGDLVVYFPEEKVAFIGDQVFLNRVPLIHVHKGGNSHLNVTYLEKMLESLDAEKFASGHSDIAGREDIRNYIKAMRERQSNISGMIKKGHSLEQVLSAFPENERLLAGTIYNEIRSNNY